MKIYFLHIILIACLVAVMVTVFLFPDKKVDFPVYIPETWEGPVGFVEGNLYVPEYGESLMDIRDNVNTNFDRITIAIELLNKRVLELEEHYCE